MMLYIYSLVVAYLIACLASICIYCKTSQLSKDTLIQDIRTVRKAFGSLYNDLIEKDFRRDDVHDYYKNTTDLDYKLLELFYGPGMHSCMQAPYPICKQGGTTRQPALILGEVRACNAKRVLEVGCGKGHCSLFLAGACDDVEFDGIDIIERHIEIAQACAIDGEYTNAHFFLGDVNDLSKQNRYDLIFGCESLCHMDDIGRASAFVTKANYILPPGGRVVIIDGFRGNGFDECSKEEKEAMCLAESGFKIKQMPSVALWIKLFTSNGFSVISNTNLTNEVLPFWTMGWRVARSIMFFPWLVKLLCLSRKRKDTLSNLVSVMFTAHAMSSGTAEYGMLVFEKE